MIYLITKAYKIMKYLENLKYILMLYVEKIKGNVQNF